MSRSQDRRTYAPLHWNVSSFASSILTSSNSTNNFMTCSTSGTSKVWKTPIMDRCNKDATSSRVIVTTHIGKWKLLVFLCHFSAKAYKSPLSPVSSEHVIRELNPVVATMPSISSVGLSNFFTFLPWKANFNLVCFWKKLKLISSSKMINSYSNII